MRITRIEGHNLASLPHFEVDLEGEVLAQAPLFAITGPTGAGKSTLLDALCLALYDRTPRLDNDRADRFTLLDEDGHTALSSRSVGAVLRKGTGYCWAEVDFVGVDARRYRTRWSLQRARKKPGKRLQLDNRMIELWELRQGEEGWEPGPALGAARRRATLATIEEKIGLSFQQFTRAVLLAQGEFAAFLEANTKERAELLERLTDQKIYGAISIRAHERAREAKKNLESLQAQERVTLSEEARSELEAQILSTQDQRRALEAQVHTAQAQQRWHEQHQTLTEEHAEAEAAVGAARAAVHEAEPLRAQLQRVLRAEPLRQARDQLTEREARLQEALARRSSTRAALRAAQARLDQAREAEAQARVALDQARARQLAAQEDLREAARLDLLLEEHRARLQEARNERARLSTQLDQATEALQQLEEQIATATQHRQGVQRELQALEADVRLTDQWGRHQLQAERAVQALARVDVAEAASDEARGALKQALARLEERASAHARATRTLAQAQEALRAHAEQRPPSSTEELSGRERELVQERSTLQRLRDLHQQLREEEARRQRLQRELAEARAAHAEHRGAHEALAPQLTRVREQVEHTREALRRAEHSLSMEEHRGLLEPGLPCPLCGSTHHPYATDAPSSAALLALEHTLASQEEQARHLEEQLDTHQHEQGLAAERARGHERQLDQLAAQTRRIREMWGELAAPLARAPELDDPDLDLDGALRQVEDGLTEVRSAQARLREWTTRAQQLDQASREAERRAHAAETAHTRAQSEAEASQKMAEQRQEELRSAREHLEDALAALVPVLGPRSGWEPALRTQPRAFLPGLEARVGRVRQLQSQLHQDEEALRTLEARRPAAEAERSTSQAQLAELQTQVERWSEQVHTTETQRHALFQGRPVSEVRHALDEAVRLCVTDHEQARQGLTQAQAALAAAQATLEAAQAHVHAAEHEHHLSAEQLEQRLTAQGLQRAALDALLAHDASWQRQQQQALTALDRRLEAALATLRERERRLDEHLQGRPEAALPQLLHLLDQLSERGQSLANAEAQLRARLEVDDRDRAHMASLEEQLAAATADAELWERMHQLIGSSKGDKFRSFAQSLTMEALLAETNAQLVSLAPRYALQRVPGEELAIQLVDHRLADTVRTVRSLSGGERFLVSLALALGLSSLSSQRANIGSLFIDEGFGTLDPDTLDQVLAALSGVQARGRTVGFISHVQGLAEKIGASVSVERVSAGTSRVRVLRANRG